LVLTYIQRTYLVEVTEANSKMCVTRYKDCEIWFNTKGWLTLSSQGIPTWWPSNQWRLIYFLKWCPIPLKAPPQEPLKICSSMETKRTENNFSLIFLLPGRDNNKNKIIISRQKIPILLLTFFPMGLPLFSVFDRGWRNECFRHKQKNDSMSSIAQRLFSVDGFVCQMTQKIYLSTNGPSYQIVFTLISFDSENKNVI